MTTHVDVSFYIGENWEIDATCRDADGTLIDIQSAEWRLANKRNLILKATVGNGIFISNTGKLSIVVTPSMQTSSNVANGSFYHELWVASPTLEGTIQFSGNLTANSSLRVTYP